MNVADEAIGYLGHSSTDMALDAFLTSIGIKKRPKHDSISTRSIVGDGITFCFLERFDYLESYSDAPNTDGELILRNIDFYKREQAQLPFGLDFDMSLDAIKNLIGEPLVAVVDIPTPSAFRPKFYFNGYFIVVHLDKKSALLEHLVVLKPTKLNKEHYGI